MFFRRIVACALVSSTGAQKDFVAESGGGVLDRRGCMCSARSSAAAPHCLDAGEDGGGEEEDPEIFASLLASSSQLSASVRRVSDNSTSRPFQNI